MTPTPEPSVPHGTPLVVPTCVTSGVAVPSEPKPTRPTLQDLLLQATSETAGQTATPSDPPLPPLPQALDHPTPAELTAAVGERRSFSPTTPGLQLVWDATSLSSFLACPTRYYYSIVLGLQPQARSVHLTFGGAYQRALELYDRRRLAGDSHREATLCALELGYREGATLPLDKRPADLPVTEPTPPAEVKRRDMLVKAIVDHCEQYADDPLHTVALADGTPAVEHSFRFDSGIDLEWNGTPIEFSGHFDRVVTHGDGGSWYILDHKTTKRAVDDGYKTKFELSTQMMHYAFSGSVVLPQAPVGVIIDTVTLLADAVRTTRFPIRYTKARLTEYYQDIRAMLPAAGEAVAAKRWPRNRESCMLCDFKRLCRVDPSIRPHIAATEFTRRMWDPAKPRTAEG